MVYYDQILHAYACQHCLTTGKCNSLCDGQGFAEHQICRSSSVSEKLFTLEHHGIFGSNYACLLISTGMQNCDEAAGVILKS